MSKRFIVMTIVLFGLIGISTTLVVLAQGTDQCPALVERALQEISNNCANLERNAACYGFNRVDATFVDEIPDDYFSIPADRAGLKTLNTIQNAPMDVNLDHWGITVMSVQANVPNSLPGQAVVFMLLGDVEVENAVPPGEVFEGLENPIPVTTLVGSNLRSSPSLNANVVNSVAAETTLDADGISPDQTWLRVIVSTGPAWISR
ncbi:MAG: SH3 domain-containing protein, partial [Anaerolineae bacterium]|nr:SH3 domain-containing protein [Anaerolineae bacterium]